MRYRYNQDVLRNAPFSLVITLSGRPKVATAGNVDSLLQVQCAGVWVLIESTLSTDDPDYCEVVVEFIDQLNERLAELDDALVARDWKCLAERAHWLKGVGGTAGFRCFVEPSQSLISLAEGRSVEGADAQILELCTMAGRIVMPSPAGKSLPGCGISLNRAIPNASVSLLCIRRPRLDSATLVINRHGLWGLTNAMVLPQCQASADHKSCVL